MNAIKNYLHWFNTMDVNLTINEKYMMITLLIIIFLMFILSNNK